MSTRTKYPSLITDHSSLVTRHSSLFTLLAVFVFLLVVAVGGARAAEVKNEVVRQEGNRVVFRYDLAGKKGEEAEVSITLTIDGKKYTMDELHLEGDFGKVKVGTDKRIYWNVLQDFPRGYSGEPTVEITAGGEGMVFVKGGCFQMGCGSWTSNCDSDEKPVHEVCVDDFYIDKYEVTQKAYREVMGENPSHFKGCDECPVEEVTWYNARDYCEKVGKRLPTEAEWEYAARSGGKRQKYAGTSGSPDAYAWYDRNSGGRTHPVGQKKPNGLGIYDMSGNVWEWVADWYDSGYYRKSPKYNPKGPSSGSVRVLRGGSWNLKPRYVRTSDRTGYNPDYGNYNIGFRCARTP